MKYATATAFRTALETRLRTEARHSGLSLVRLRKAVVFDRLLARLLAVAPERWVLKGGLALEYRFGSRARTTKDMDLGRHDDVATATADFIAAQHLNLDDWFVFAIVPTNRLDALLDAAAVRYRVTAEVAGRLFETVVVDVGFGDAATTRPDLLTGTSLLSFADLPPIAVPALPLPYHTAEKLHAYTRQYGPQMRESTRVKDLVDLALIATTATMQASSLSEAISQTFAGRGAQGVPATLPPPPTGWTREYRRLAPETGLDPDIATGYMTVQTFIDPVLTGKAPSAAEWRASDGAWLLR